MKCPICKKEFAAIRVDAQYCGVNCRSQAYRMRLRMAARREQVGEPEPDPMASRSRKRAELLTAATGSGKSPRVALEQQVLSQVPPRAVRYRLVLGVEQQFQHAVIAPESSAWNLMPFEAPNDLRLLPGHTYRIVWIDRQGAPVRPLEWAPIPSLHFFLGEPDAEISAQQVESRYRTQTLMQLRQQVDQLEQQLVRAKRKQRAQKSAMRLLKQRAKERIAALKLLHHEDSFKTFVERWAPVAAIGAAMYWLGKPKESSESPESAPGDAPADSDIRSSTVELDILPMTQRVHPLRDSFAMLSDLVESRDEVPTDQELAQMPLRKLWSRIGTWLENATLTRSSRPAEPSNSSEWQAIHRVSDATSALAFMSQTLREGESGKSLSSCGRTLLRESERFDRQFRSWINQRNLTEPLSQTDRTELLSFSADLASILRDSQLQSGDAFGQVLHDALNATRIRLLGTAGDHVAAPQRARKGVPLNLRSLALIHGPQVLKRYMKQLLEDRANMRDLLAKDPRRSTPSAESEDDDHADDSTNSDQSHRPATHRDDANENPARSESAQANPLADTAPTCNAASPSSKEPADLTAPSASTDAQPRTEARSTAAHAATAAERILSTNSINSDPGAAQPRTRETAPTQSNPHHEHPTLPPDELIRQLIVVLAEHPSWREIFASELNPAESTEASRGRRGPLSGIMESLDPALRQDLLDAVVTALQVPKNRVGPN